MQTCLLVALTAMLKLANPIQDAGATPSGQPAAADPRNRAAGPDAQRLNDAAQAWLARAESGDLIPAWSKIKDAPRGIPAAFVLGPPLIKQTRSRCQFHSELQRRALLMCQEVFGNYQRADTPRAGLQFRAPAATFLPFSQPSSQPPVANIMLGGGNGGGGGI